MIIPAINCADFGSANKNIRLAERFLPPSTGWIHLDVSDGRFSNFKSWGDPEEFLALRPHLRVEVHLMVENPEEEARRWFKTGVEKIIFPLKRGEKMDKNFLKDAKKNGVKIVPSFDMSVPIEEALPYLQDFEEIHLLAVSPGPSGQRMNPDVVRRLQFLRGENRGVKIEVDGGVDPTTARDLLEAGADVLVSGNYIFQHSDPALAYKELDSLI